MSEETITRDLGTYHLRVEFVDGSGFIHRIHTGNRFSHGGGGNHPLYADPIKPTWRDENHLIQSTVFQWTENNYSCDCNRLIFLARAAQDPIYDESVDPPCGDTIQLKRLTLLRPDMSEKVIWEKNP